MLNILPRRRCHGMTLVELLVVLSILFILFALSIPAYTTFNTNQKLNQSVQSLAQTLRDAQNRGTNNDSSVKCNLASPAPSPDQSQYTSFDGWYVKVTKTGTSYTLSGRCGTVQSLAQDVNSKTYTFPVSTISISDITDQAGTSYNTMYVLFSPLNQTVRFFNTAGPMLGSEVTSITKLTIWVTQASTTKKISVTAQGSIYVE